MLDPSRHEPDRPPRRSAPTRWALASSPTSPGRAALITGLAVLGYVVTVYLIFFLTYTPLNVDHVRGVQGRYFVIALPMAAIFLASMTNIDLPRGALATITGSLLSGITSFQALLGAHWSVPGSSPGSAGEAAKV
jgi:hypothetical protein